MAKTVLFRKNAIILSAIAIIDELGLQSLATKVLADIFIDRLQSRVELMEQGRHKGELNQLFTPVELTDSTMVCTGQYIHKGVHKMKKVLIVDDAMFIRLTLKTMLEKNGFEVVGEGEDGRDGVQKYKMLRPDIVTLDVTMPEMDGIAALKEIRKIDANAKVVMVSAMGQELIIKEAIINGARNFIVKPFKEEHVIKTLNAV